MFSFFSPDSKFMQVVSRFSDLVVLNILFLLTCLPLFTIGAAFSAMYTVTFRMIRSREEPVTRSYFRAFRENFKQSTVLWLILLFVGLPAVFYIDRFYTMSGILHYLFVPFLTVFLGAVFVFSYAFPWVSQFRNSNRETLVNALLLSLGNLPRTLAVSVINLLPPALFLFQYELFLKISFLWMALYFAAAAYMNSAILWKVFQPYYPEES